METFTSLLNEIGERLNDEAELGDEIEQQKDLAIVELAAAARELANS